MTVHQLCWGPFKASFSREFEPMLGKHVGITKIVVKASDGIKGFTVFNIMNKIA